MDAGEQVYRTANDRVALTLLARCKKYDRVRNCALCLPGSQRRLGCWRSHVWLDFDNPVYEGSLFMWRVQQGDGTPPPGWDGTYKFQPLEVQRQAGSRHKRISNVEKALTHLRGVVKLGLFRKL